MKKLAKFLIPVFILVAFSACEKDNVTTTDSLTSDDALVSAKIDIASDDVSNIMDQLFDAFVYESFLLPPGEKI